VLAKKTGITIFRLFKKRHWIPAFAGMTFESLFARKSLSHAGDNVLRTDGHKIVITCM